MGEGAGARVEEGAAVREDGTAVRAEDGAAVRVEEGAAVRVEVGTAVQLGEVAVEAVEEDLAALERGTTVAGSGAKPAVAVKVGVVEPDPGRVGGGVAHELGEKSLACSLLSVACNRRPHNTTHIPARSDPRGARVQHGSAGVCRTGVSVGESRGLQG
eukprot:gene7669-biopygen8833